MCSSSAKSVVALCLIMLLCRSCKASDSDETQNCSSLCGYHNIRSPFRLKDSPEKCGDKMYELSCEKNHLFLYQKSGRYILSINYDNYTIRVRDGNVVKLNSSSLPIYSFTDFFFSQRDPYTPTINARNENGTWEYYELNTNMIYIRCEHPVHSPGFVDTSTCFNTSNVSPSTSLSSNVSPSPSPSSSSSNSYSYVGSRYVGGVGLEENCLIEGMYMTSWPALKNQSWSCTEIHNMVLYGFELSWLNSFCPGSEHGYVIFLGGKEPRCERAAASISIFTRILCVILDACSISELSLIMIVGLWCIRVKPNDNPSMDKVGEILEGNEIDLEMPQQPCLYPQDIPNVDISNHSSSIVLPSDLLATNNKETTSFSTQQDGTAV